MRQDLNIALIHATVLIEQTNHEGRKFFGTGWIVDLSEAGVKKSALVTAFHVFDQMQGPQVKLNWRRQDENQTWHMEPKTHTIRDKAGKPMWYKHPDFDIAVITIDAPKPAQKAAIPLSWLADEGALLDYEIGPSDELLTLGYPRGLSANKMGFPILRSGRVASYPLSPIKSFPTFLMDFAVFTGNSGGPVYLSERVRKRCGASETHEAHLVLGLLVQQVELSETRLEIGIVIHAQYVRDALKSLIANEKSFLAV